MPGEQAAAAACPGETRREVWREACDPSSRGEVEAAALSAPRRIAYPARPGADKPQGVYFKVTPEQEKAIVKMVAKGEKIARIARTTGLSRPTIYRVMRNQAPA
jgi:DNA invertase Pin-like site-specific DNA recombinase